MKKCPFCAEQIQDEAIKCRYCGSMLSEAAGGGMGSGGLGETAKSALFWSVLILGAILIWSYLKPVS